MATVVMLLAWLSSVRADGPADESSVAAMVKAMREEMREQTAKQEEQVAKQAVQMREQTAKQAAQMAEQAATQAVQMAELKDEVTKKDEAIAALTDALKARSEPKHVQLTAGGEVVELVSAADVKAREQQAEAYARRMDTQDAEIGKLREELKNSRAGAPPAPSPSPPLSLRRPAATPARRLQTASSGDPVTELSLTGQIAAVSWNSRTPGLIEVALLLKYRTSARWADVFPD